MRKKNNIKIFLLILFIGLIIKTFAAQSITVSIDSVTRDTSPTNVNYKGNSFISNSKTNGALLIYGQSGSGGTYVLTNNSSATIRDFVPSSAFSGIPKYTVANGTTRTVTAAVSNTDYAPVIDAIFSGSLQLPNGASPTTDTFGELAGDNNAWASGHGALQFYDGTANTYIVGVLSSDTPNNGQVPTWNTGGTITWETPTATGGFTNTIVCSISGGDFPITAGGIKYVYVPYNCTIIAAIVSADQSGSIVLDVWKDSYANYPPTVADTITASAKPTLSSAIKSKDTTLTGWTTSISADDFLAVKIDSASVVTDVTLTLVVKNP